MSKLNFGMCTRTHGTGAQVELGKRHSMLGANNSISMFDSTEGAVLLLSDHRLTGPKVRLKRTH